MLRLLDGEEVEQPPFAPPYLRAGGRLIGQTANILLYLGPRHDLAPTAEAERLWAHQLQLTIADLVDEAHDTHHPIASSLYYEDQHPEAKRRAADFLKSRVPKYLGYFEKVLGRNKARGGHLVAASRCSRSWRVCAMPSRMRWHGSSRNTRGSWHCMTPSRAVGGSPPIWRPIAGSRSTSTASSGASSS